MRDSSRVRTQFQCNICDFENETYLDELTRETPTCASCGSTVRMRSIIQTLTAELFGKSMTISEITPPRPDIVGIGMSCWDGYAIPLAHRIAFKNTFYHQEPRLDIMNIDQAACGSLDFIVSTDVFEHVASPVHTAFVNARRLLKADGVFIFTVPYFYPGEERVVTTENFNDLHDYTVFETDLGLLLKNIRKSGEIQYFHNLIFHGGPGETLEMRRFSEWSVLENLKNAGFNDISIYRNDNPQYGVYWPLLHSAPIAARVKPNSSHQNSGALRYRII